MITYLATYPRSGASLAQNLVFRGLGRVVSAVKAGGGDNQFLDRWGVTHGPETAANMSAGLIWDDRVTTYLDDGRPRRIILPGPLDYLTEERRRAFAAEDTNFIIKLHAPPFERYFEGERAINVVRHPGAVLWSYFRYLVDFVMERDADHIFERPPPTLSRVIAGETPFGDWSDYHRAWEAAGLPRLVLRYETLAADAAPQIDRIGAFLETPVLSHEVMDFATYAARFPGKGLRGASEGYEAFYTAPQLGVLNDRHGALMARLGYDPPAAEAGGEAGQVERLERIMETAWTWGQRFNEQRRAAGQRILSLNAKLGRPPAPD